MPTFRRKAIIAIAKALRDEPSLNKAGKTAAVRALHRLFYADNQLYAEKVFRAVAAGDLEDDTKTHTIKIGDF